MYLAILSVEKMKNYWSCTACGDGTHEDMVQCDNCLKWLHYKCAENFDPNSKTTNWDFHDEETEDKGTAQQ